LGNLLPVATAPPGRAGQEAAAMQKIFLPVDGSDHSRRAVKLASELAGLAGGEVHAFHYRERDVARGAPGGLETAEDAQELMEEVLAELRQAGISASGETRPGLYGEAAKAIVAEAAATGSDIIVMGSRGLSDFQALLVGSVAHKVLHHAHCPVLIVR
jgi:nucleotide-binding universal stress UspA family protein